MMLEHKAFVFAYDAFMVGLAPILDAALRSGELFHLLSFIEEKKASLRDPDEGEPLSSNWRQHLVINDAHELGDIALTLYYDPVEDIGLGYDWGETYERLQVVLPGQTQILLGGVLGPQENYFDPGKMGAYFQSPKEVSLNIQSLNHLLSEYPTEAEMFMPVLTMLKRTNKTALGLYITF